MHHVLELQSNIEVLSKEHTSLWFCYVLFLWNKCAFAMLGCVCIVSF